MFNWCFVSPPSEQLSFLVFSQSLFVQMACNQILLLWLVGIFCEVVPLDRFY